MQDARGLDRVFDDATDIDHLRRMGEFYSAAQVAVALGLSLSDLITFCANGRLTLWPLYDVGIIYELIGSKFTSEGQRTQLERHLRAWRDHPSVVEILPGWAKNLQAKDVDMRALSKLMRMAVKMNLRDTAAKLQVSVSSMKTFCRKYGMGQWPHRTLAAVVKLPDSPHLSDAEKESVQKYVIAWDADPMACMTKLPAWIEALKRKHYKSKNKCRDKYF